MKGAIPMNAIRTIAASALLLNAACSSLNKTTVSKQYDDDVYYSPKDVPAVVAAPSPAPVPAVQNENAAGVQPGTSAENNYTPEGSSGSGETERQGGDTYVTNNYYSDDDYYDYAYSSRIRRFHHPYNTWGYYDDYYTNVYWYDYNPYSWGTSIYLGYPWWGPSFYYSCSPFYTGYYGYSYYPYTWGGYGYYPGYGNYWSGYNHGYHHGYNDGYHDGYYGGSSYHPYYYNSHDQNSVSPGSSYYGPRDAMGSNNKTSAPPSTLADRYMRSAGSEKRVTVPDIHVPDAGEKKMASPVGTPGKSSGEGAEGRTGQGSGFTPGQAQPSPQARPENRQPSPTNNTPVRRETPVKEAPVKENRPAGERPRQDNHKPRYKVDDTRETGEQYPPAKSESGGQRYSSPPVKNKPDNTPSRSYTPSAPSRDASPSRSSGGGSRSGGGAPERKSSRSR